ncbi:MAG TPA: RNA polymerase sigma factor [Solirubrobacterales bacterium]|nr:RNA polymerase sigma factor [Solirubrobacterales bacterium]
MEPLEATRGQLSEQLAEASFRRLYTEHGREMLAYALRRVGDPEDAADVAAETFLVAWRRLEDVPAGAQARLWLYGVARRTLANQRRGERRRERLGERLRADLVPALAEPPEPLGPDVLAALERLGAEDREILRLSAWEELSPSELATVLGTSAVAARSRLHRARRRLRRALEEGEGR